MAKTTLTDEWGAFTAIPNQFIQAAAALPDKARWLFVLLRYHTNKQSGEAFPSYDTLKQETGWAYSTIAQAVRDLEKHGWLVRKKQFSGNTHYILRRPPIDDSADSSVLGNDQSSSNQRNEETADFSQSSNFARTGQISTQSSNHAHAVLQSSEPNKKEITKTEINKTEDLLAKAHNASSPSAPKPGRKSKPKRRAKPKPKESKSSHPDPIYEAFCAKFAITHGGAFYTSKRGDFIQLAEMRKRAADKEFPLTDNAVDQALTNYFASDAVSRPTLADFAVNFGIFYANRLDRYNRVEKSNTNGAQNGTHQSKFESREDRNNRNTRRTLEILGIVDSRASSPGNAGAQSGDTLIDLPSPRRMLSGRD